MESSKNDGISLSLSSLEAKQTLGMTSISKLIRTASLFDNRVLRIPPKLFDRFFSKTDIIMEEVF